MIRLEPGTHVVTRRTLPSRVGPDRPAGSRGVVVGRAAHPEGALRVEFPDGQTEVVDGAHLAARASLRPLLADDGAHERFAVEEWVAWRCVVGPRARGLEGAWARGDVRGFFIPPAAVHWSLRGAPSRLTDPDGGERHLELAGFLKAAADADPEALECLFTPLVEHRTPIADALQAVRGAFLSQRVLDTCVRPALDAWDRFDGKPDPVGWTEALRGLVIGVVVLREHRFPVYVDHEREALLAVRRGEATWPQARLLHRRLLEELEAAVADSRLPDEPDMGRIDRFLVEARRTMVG